MLTVWVAGALAGTLPLTKQTETGHVGVAGWVAPDTTMNTRGGRPEGASWLGFGFAAEWGKASGPERH
jgi:hypothetical protein